MDASISGRLIQADQRAEKAVASGRFFPRSWSSMAEHCTWLGCDVVAGDNNSEKALSVEER